MKKIGWILKVGSIATLLATTSISFAAAAQQAKPGIIVLASTSQVLLQRSAEGAAPGGIESSTQAAAIPHVNSAPVWVPRIRRGAPANRIGGATRGRNTEVTNQTLVPAIDEAALTLAAQPNLHWHLSADTPHAVNFSLLDPDRIEPMVDVMIPGPFQAGFHVLSLADHEAQFGVRQTLPGYVPLLQFQQHRLQRPRPAPTGGAFGARQPATAST